MVKQDGNHLAEEWLPSYGVGKLLIFGSVRPACCQKELAFPVIASRTDTFTTAEGSDIVQ